VLRTLVVLGAERVHHVPGEWLETVLRDLLPQYDLALQTLDLGMEIAKLCYTV